VKTKIFILFTIGLIIFTSGCTTKQIAQVVYDSVKSDECMKKKGESLCDFSNQ